MSKFFETHSEDQVRRLASLVRQLAEREIGPVETTPAAGWRMGLPARDAGQALRTQIWESMKDFPEDCFPIRLPWLEGTEIELLHPSENGRQIFVSRSFDPNEFWVLKHFLKPGDTFIDVGANIGLYSIFAAGLVGPSGHVYAFEPSRREARSLNRNADLNRLANIRCFELAVGANESKALLHVADSEFDGHNSLGALSLARHVNLRYTVDRQDYKWTSFARSKTQIAVGRAAHLEIVIYAESAFDFILQDLVIGPEGAVLGPWIIDESSETPTAIPALVRSNFSGAAISTFGDAKLAMRQGALRIQCATAGGAAFRWQLDSEISSLVTLEGQPRAEGASETYPVDVVALDALFLKPGMPKVCALKIDVEGFEKEVLAGAKTLISEHRPLILIEVANELLETKNTSAADIAKALNAHGYILFDAAEGKPRLVDLNGEHSSNVFAVPEHLLDEMLALGGLEKSALTSGLSQAAEKPAKSPKQEMEQDSPA